MEFGPIDRVISIPGKRLFAAVEGQRQVLLFSMDAGLELVHTVPTPSLPASGKAPLADAVIAADEEAGFNQANDAAAAATTAAATTAAAAKEDPTEAEANRLREAHRVLGQTGF